MFETVVCSSLQESRQLLEREDFALVFCEDRFEDGAYRDLLTQAQRPRRVPVVVMISTADPDAIFQDAMALGALGVVPVPCSRKDVQWMVIRATQQGQARRSAR
jgi:DNA-binding NtrC family response regulator